MDEIGALIFFAAMIWSIIGGALSKKGKRGAPPPGRDPAPGRGDERHPAPYREAPVPGGEGGPAPAGSRGAAADDGRTESSAAVMVPDDLWEILTGERRAPAPAGVPEDVPGDARGTEPGERWSADAELRAAGDEAVSAESGSLEEVPRLEEPVVVSLETPPLPAERRHQVFHERLASATESARPARAARPPHAFGGRPSLRRAMVLREVLGPPKALE